MVRKKVPGNHSKCWKVLLCSPWQISMEGTHLNLETIGLSMNLYKEIKDEVKDLRTDLVKRGVVERPYD